MRPAPLPSRVGVAARRLAPVVCLWLAACGRTEDDAASRGGVRPPAAATASAAASTVAQAGVADRTFVANATAAGLFEVQLGQLAGAQTDDASMKAYASMLVDDLASAHTELAQLAAVRGIALPTQPSREAQAELKKLGRESGAGFDRNVVELAARTQRRDIDDFENAARRSQDDELKAWIERALPTLRQHLGEAERLASTLAPAPVAAASGAGGRSAAAAGARVPATAPRTGVAASRPAPAAAASAASTS